MQNLKKKISVIGELTIPFIIFFTLYSFTICGAPPAVLDSIYYLVEIDNSAKLSTTYTPFHPHHLLYKSLVNLWLTGCKLIRLPLNTEFLVALLNAFFGALTLCVFYWLLRKRLGFDRLVALLGTALPALSFGFWLYSVSIEVYIIPLFFLMLSLYLLSVDHPNKITFLLVGLSHGLAVLFHQVNVLFIPTVLLAAFLYHRNKTVSIRQSLTYYIPTFSLTVITPYMIVIFGILNLHWHRNVLHWLTLYAHKSEYWYSLTPSNLVKAGIGLSRSIIGFNFIFAISKIKPFIDKIAIDHCLIDNVFSVRNLGQNTAYMLLAMSLILLLALLINTLLKLRNWHSLQSNQRNLLALTTTWFTAYGIFFIFWVPVSAEFWIPQSVCLWLVFLTLFPSSKGSTTTILKQPVVSLSIITTLLFTLNFFGGIKFIRDSDNNFYYKKIAPIIKIAQPDDLIIIGPPSTSVTGPATKTWYSKTLHSYLLQHTDADILNLIQAYEESKNKRRPSEKLVTRIKRAVRKTLTKGNKVFIFKEVINLRPEHLQNFGDIDRVINKLQKKYKADRQKIDFGTETVYIIE